MDQILQPATVFAIYSRAGLQNVISLLVEANLSDLVKAAEVYKHRLLEMCQELNLGGWKKCSVQSQLDRGGEKL